MKIDKPYITEQRASLLQQRTQHLANITAVDGALQMLEALEKQLDTPAPKAKTGENVTEIAPELAAKGAK